MNPHDFAVLAEGLVIPEATIQIGVRSSGEREAREYVKTRGGEIYPAHQLRRSCAGFRSCRTHQ